LSDNILIAGTSGGGVFLSSNRGSTWSQHISGLTNLNVSALAIKGSDLFVGTLGGGVFLSTNRGGTWAPMDSGLTNLSVSALAVSNSYLFAATNGGGIFLSTNTGSRWSSVNYGLSNLNVRALDVSGATLCAGTIGGVFVSSNSGSQWTQVNSGLADTLVTALVLKNTNLFVGTALNGVWKRPLSEMITSVGWQSTIVPAKFNLEQNYPNPFNPSTIIRYGLPTRTHVTLSIFNALGQLVATLVNGDQDAGSHQVQFDGSRLASGVYFYRLMAGDYFGTKRLALLR
jgi:ligand-binding sensor domain-containing protein